MRTLCSLIAVAILLTTSAAVLAHTADDPLVVNLIAGNPKNNVNVVGRVEVWNDSESLYVKYVVDAPYWHLGDTHLAVATSLGGIPQTKKGNPPPGQFPYKEKSPEYKGGGLYEIPLSSFDGTPLYIAAHGGACIDDGPSSMLPDQVTEEVDNPGAYGYFQTIVTEGGVLNNTYQNGFCIDTNKFEFIAGGVEYLADVYSSYDPNLPGSTLVEHPENLDLVNYIVNQNYVGQPSTSGGNYTFGDVQVAIWMLLEDPLGIQVDPTDPDIAPWDQDRVDEIIADAMANGDGFVPECGELVVIVLVPFTGDIFSWENAVQPNIIPVPVKCDDCETAWGDGDPFPGKNWAMYFNYEVQDGTPAPPRMSFRSKVTTTWGSIKDR